MKLAAEPKPSDLDPSLVPAAAVGMDIDGEGKRKGKGDSKVDRVLMEDDSDDEDKYPKGKNWGRRSRRIHKRRLIQAVMKKGPRPKQKRRSKFKQAKAKLNKLLK
eukprot:TRINITY_DN68156_c3_g1_i1.p3 TRINITY_DN68156_c3_g1~~TRINITY_DN68156_c3_g1_i1.p3  ORF type:complete len:105 (+),score=69.16 TRINITY_DN68156_c3_g1_i1:176-490(+)